MRKIFFWFHLALGSVAGIVIFIMCVSGIVLAFERQINARDAAQFHFDPPQNADRLPLERLLAKGRASSVTIRSDPGAPLEIVYGRERTAFVNPYTGAVLGEGSKKLRAFFGTVEKWHRALGGEMRGGLGRKITGVCNLLFAFIIPSGFYLWLPRKWRWQNFKSVLLFHSGLEGRQRDWNWHHVAGIWCALPLFFIVVTGVNMSYGTPPRTGAIRTSSPGTQTPLSLASLMTKAGNEVPGWRSITYRIQPRDASSIALTVDHGNGGQPRKRVQVTLDKATGAVLASESSNLRVWGRFIHTGEAGGLLGQIVAALASLGGSLLVWTGLSLAFRRFVRFTRRFQLDRRLIPADPMIK